MTNADLTKPASVAEVVRQVAAVQSHFTDKTARLACEYGFKACQRGRTLAEALAEFDKIMGPQS